MANVINIKRFTLTLTQNQSLSWIYNLMVKIGHQVEIMKKMIHFVIRFKYAIFWVCFMLMFKKVDEKWTVFWVKVRLSTFILFEVSTDFKFPRIFEKSPYLDKNSPIIVVWEDKKNLKNSILYFNVQKKSYHIALLVFGGP